MGLNFRPAFSNPVRFFKPDTPGICWGALVCGLCIQTTPCRIPGWRGLKKRPGFGATPRGAISNPVPFFQTRSPGSFGKAPVYGLCIHLALLPECRGSSLTGVGPDYPSHYFKPKLFRIPWAKNCCFPPYNRKE